MDGRGGCCIARYAGGGAAAYEANQMQRAMLRFRPIAPKPSIGGSVFGGSSSSSENNSHKVSSGETTQYVKAGRGKRRYNTTRAKRNSYSGGRRKRVKTSSLGDESSGITVVTLPLLPESPTENKTPTSRFEPSAPIWLSFNTTTTQNNVQQQHKKTEVAGSVVTVECVTEMWASGCGGGLGRTTEEQVRSLEWDTCPGFITDAENRVTWTNRAYKKMVVREGGGDVMVWLVMKDRVPVSCPAFTCRVRVQRTCSKEIKILPCDVWRLGCRGFAWRLDVEAALSLGR